MEHLLLHCSDEGVRTFMHVWPASANKHSYEEGICTIMHVWPACIREMGSRMYAFTEKNAGTQLFATSALLMFPSFYSSCHAQDHPCTK